MKPCRNYTTTCGIVRKLGCLGRPQSRVWPNHGRKPRRVLASVRVSRGRRGRVPLTCDSTRNHQRLDWESAGCWCRDADDKHLNSESTDEPLASSTSTPHRSTDIAASVRLDPCGSASSCACAPQQHPSSTCSRAPEQSTTTYTSKHTPSALH